MPRNVTKIRIFIASPGDTQEERISASQIIEELNKINPIENIEFELIKWETHTYSGIGDDAQDVINKEIDDNYDIFIGLMWKKFGSPTKRSSSGTEEEFLRALEIYNRKSQPIKILFYFSQTAISPKDIDTEQLDKINQFKTSLQETGVYYWDYSNIKEFEGFLRVHISKAARELINDLKINTVKIVEPILEHQKENDDEEGLIELIEGFTEEFTEIGSVLGRMTELMTDLGEKISKRAEEINSVDMRTLKPQEIKRLIDKASTDMQIYVKRMETEMPIFKEAMGNGFDYLTRAYSLYYTDWNEGAKEDINTFQMFEELLQTMIAFKSQMNSLKSQIVILPRATTNFNKAKRDTEKIIKALVSEVDSALNQIKEMIKLKED
jgi:hypothetical protein